MKKSQNDNIRHLQDYRKTPSSSSVASRPADARYGYSRETAEKPPSQGKKRKAKEARNKKAETNPQKAGHAAAKEQRGRPLHPEQARPAKKKQEALPIHPRKKAPREKNGRPLESSKSSAPVLVRRKDRHRLVTMLFMALLVFFCALIVGIIGRNAEISKIRLEIGTLEKQVTQEKNKVKELKMKLETSNRTDYIEDRARQELGMDYIKDDQIVYIDVE